MNTEIIIIIIDNKIKNEREKQMNNITWNMLMK